jgi:hypothetical protein
MGSAEHFSKVPPSDRKRRFSSQQSKSEAERDAG